MLDAKSDFERRLYFQPFVRDLPRFHNYFEAEWNISDVQFLRHAFRKGILKCL